MQASLELIENFHGHLGPYVVLGYRMGAIANRMLGEGGFSKRAHVLTGTTPPISCLIDGVQLASGCTLGKGNITVEDKGLAKAIFTDRNGRSVEIYLVSGLTDKIKESFDMNNPKEFCEWVWKAREEELFTVQERD